MEERKFIEGKLTEITSYTYDLHGNVLQKKVQNVADGYQTVDDYRYDEQGNMIYNAAFHNDLLIFENKCSYDAEGNLTAEEFFEIDRWEKKVLRHERLLHASR